MIIIVNIFAITAAIFYFSGKVGPLAFLMSSTLWFALMLAFWVVLPMVIYNKAATFKDHFKVSFEDQHMFLENEKGGRSWPWKDFSYFVESVNFFHLYFNSQSFFIIPKTAFPLTELPAIRLFLKERVHEGIK